MSGNESEIPERASVSSFASHKRSIALADNLMRVILFLSEKYSAASEKKLSSKAFRWVMTTWILTVDLMRSNAPITAICIRWFVDQGAWSVLASE
jgi:hypothetical protein